MKIDIEKIKKIIESRIITAPFDFKTNFPDVIKGEVHWIAFANEKLILLVFLDAVQMRRVVDYDQRGFEPFPGLITTEPSLSAMMRMEKSKNNFVTGSSVSGMYSFSIGQDSTFIIQDHTQKLKTKEMGEVEYKVPLAYIISFGEDIEEDNAYQSLDELIAYSIKVWRGER